MANMRGLLQILLIKNTESTKGETIRPSTSCMRNFTYLGIDPIEKGPKGVSVTPPKDTGK